MGVTIYDIAEKASVSIATVSRVLNKNPRVSPETRARVLKVADDLGYEPHPSAQSLARRKSSLVSAVIPMVTNYFFMEVLRGLQARLAQTEYDLLVYSARTMEEVGTQLERALHRGRSAGVLLFSSPIRPPQLARVRRSGQPTVLVDCFHSEFDSVSIDNEQGGYLAARHLIDQGRERIAIIMANPGSVPAADRLKGYRRALEESGMDPVDAHIVASHDEETHGYTESHGREAMEQLLARDPVPDAVFATSDLQALGAFSAIRDAGLTVPSDVSIVGFDDIRLSEHLGLSTLRQPMYDLGRLATEKLLTRIAEPDRLPTHTVLSPHLVKRGSSVIELAGHLGSARSRSSAVAY